MHFPACRYPPIPSSPVTGGAQPVENAEQRAAVVTLLEKARELSNVRAQPYDLKTTFVTSGGLPSRRELDFGRHLARAWPLPLDRAGTELRGRQSLQQHDQRACCTAISREACCRCGWCRSARRSSSISLRSAPSVPFRTATGYVNGAAQTLRVDRTRCPRPNFKRRPRLG